MLVGMQKGIAVLEDWQFFTKLNLLLINDLATVLLGIYPKVLKTFVYTKTFTQISTGALLKIGKLWKKLRCPSVGK